MSSDLNISCIVFGASGYAGAELARLIYIHPHLQLDKLFVSAHSADADKRLSDLYPQLYGLIDTPLTAGTEQNIDALLSAISASKQTYIFLATPHEFSHDMAHKLISDKVTVFDLSGGFRLKDPAAYESYYGFEHKYSELLEKAPYGLPEWNAENLAEHKLISLPGCYPTASQLALKPLVQNDLLQDNCIPVINAVSGVSGAGRKANLATSYCELSLKPYNLFIHRHTPEIIQGLGRKVIFTPHVADFDRGILATIVVQVKDSVTEQDIAQAFSDKYENQPLVRLRKSIPTIKDVVNTPFCDLYWQLNGDHLIVISAIDNLLKGASSQAIQCANLVSGLSQEMGLLPVPQSKEI